MSKQIIVARKDNDGADYLNVKTTGANTFLGFDSDDELKAMSTADLVLARQRNGRTRLFADTEFQLLPATSVAAGSDKMFLELGVNTEVIARATGGGLSLTTAAAEDDNASIAPVANTPFIACPITATALHVLTARVKPVTLTKVVHSFGFNENAGTEATNVLPTATAGDGAMFLFDPLDECGSTLAGAATNWLLAHKVNGTDTFTDTGIAVAAQDYELRIEMQADYKCKFYIDNVLVGTGPALTLNDVLKVGAGVQVGAAGGASTMVIRYITLSTAIV